MVKGSVDSTLVQNISYTSKPGKDCEPVKVCFDMPQANGAISNFTVDCVPPS